jgi:hypothetical protein
MIYVYIAIALIIIACIASRVIVFGPREQTTAEQWRALFDEDDRPDSG